MAEEPDIPSPIDLRSAADARAWAETAERKRPWRPRLRAAIADAVVEHAAGKAQRVLELGPGPGWLAEELLGRGVVERYTLLDFSLPMLEMCRARLGFRPELAYVHGDFAGDAWPAMVEGPFDAVVAMQSTHELRHKRHLARLYRHARGVLRAGGLLVVCDHEPGEAADARRTALFATVAEQREAMRMAGFGGVVARLELEGMYVISAIAGA